MILSLILLMRQLLRRAHANKGRTSNGQTATRGGARDVVLGLGGIGALFGLAAWIGPGEGLILAAAPAVARPDIALGAFLTGLSWRNFERIFAAHSASEDAGHGHGEARPIPSSTPRTRRSTPHTRRGEDGQVFDRSVAGPKVLVVEDNPINQQIAAAMLASQGVTFDLVGNGEEAVNQVQSEPYGLVLMDIQMPIMDGIEATRRIRALPGPISHIPIVAVTANAMKGDRETYLGAGMDDFVPKPIDPPSLISIVESYLADDTKVSVQVG